MITIGDDQIRIEDHREEARIKFSALGGPDDPIEVSATDDEGNQLLAFEMSCQDIDAFQTAFANFLNTGYFDQEG